MMDTSAAPTPESIQKYVLHLKELLYGLDQGGDQFRCTATIKVGKALALLVEPGTIPLYNHTEIVRNLEEALNILTQTRT